MAFLGSLGKAIGLGSTGDVVKSAALAYGTGSPAPLIGAFESQQGQSVAVDRPKLTTPQESQTSGTIEMGPPVTAGVGALVPGLTGSVVGAVKNIAPRVFSSPVGQIGLGTGVGLGLDALSGAMMGGQQMRITRKQQSQVKQMVELIGIEQAASILGLSVADVAMIVTKKFRSRGQGITAAQLRTATRVNNRIIHMHDKLKSAYGTAARRTTTRRATGTRVTQIKN